jgi:hypothetical protein
MRSAADILNALLGIFSTYLLFRSYRKRDPMGIAVWGILLIQCAIWGTK